MDGGADNAYLPYLQIFNRELKCDDFYLHVMLLRECIDHDDVFGESSAQKEKVSFSSCATSAVLGAQTRMM